MTGCIDCEITVLSELVKRFCLTHKASLPDSREMVEIVRVCLLEILIVWRVKVVIADAYHYRDLWKVLLDHLC